MANRQYEAATIFNCRIVDMRHLWTPSMEYQGKPTQKPNHFASFIAPKTVGHWSQEPIFAGVMQAFQKLLGGQMQAYAQNVNAVQWPISDGDMPNAQGKQSEFAKGHWIFSASTGNLPTIELAQAGGALVKLPGRTGVKSGDHCMVGVTAAQKSNQANGVKFYLNAVVFSAPGEEIVFANSVSGAELMQQAQRQGLQVAGFSPAGFGGPQQGGFQQPPQGGFAPTGAPAFGGAPAPGPQVPGTFGTPQPGGFASPSQPGPANGNATFPSNPHAQPQGFHPGQAPQQFGAPPAFTPPGGGFGHQ